MEFLICRDFSWKGPLKSETKPKHPDSRSHSRLQSPRSFWPVAGIKSSRRTRFSEYAQSIRFEFSTNQIWWEVRESRTSDVRPSQSSRSLPQARRIVGSGDENDYASRDVLALFRFSVALFNWHLGMLRIPLDTISFKVNLSQRFCQGCLS